VFLAGGLCLFLQTVSSFFYGDDISENSISLFLVPMVLFLPQRTLLSLVKVHGLRVALRLPPLACTKAVRGLMYSLAVSVLGRVFAAVAV